MLGRGIDQILPHPSNPRLFESCVKNANIYVRLAEQTSGPLPKRPLHYAYPWGDTLAELEEHRPDARIINLETSVTTSESSWPAKGIHYRMHPGNVECISSARVDCCVLSNNHVLDWGHAGLPETLETLHSSGIKTAGAGINENDASAPAILEMSEGRRLLIFGYADESSGVPESWAATKRREGVNFLHDGISAASADSICRQIAKERRPEGKDIVICSLHWGENWGYQISREERQFAHRLIDSGCVDILHGHSSHHAKGLEIYRGKLILYGCGDFLNDYEGISGHDEYRDDCTLMYFPRVNSSDGTLLSLFAVPMQIKHMRLNRANDEVGIWLSNVMQRECAKFEVNVQRDPVKNILLFNW
uniref:Polyglutamate synthase n=1 Tax=Meloidogyne artiellia TaxID=42426 RepID=Q8T376_MELAT|nr:polyglutamate synthase [Meloidogyne artiellia]